MIQIRNFSKHYGKRLNHNGAIQQMLNVSYNEMLNNISRDTLNQAITDYFKEKQKRAKEAKQNAKNKKDKKVKFQTPSKLI